MHPSRAAGMHRRRPSRHRQASDRLQRHSPLTARPPPTQAAGARAWLRYGGGACQCGHLAGSRLLRRVVPVAPSRFQCRAGSPAARGIQDVLPAPVAVVGLAKVRRGLDLRPPLPSRQPLAHLGRPSTRRVGRVLYRLLPPLPSPL